MNARIRIVPGAASILAGAVLALYSFAMAQQPSPPAAPAPPSAPAPAAPAQPSAPAAPAAPAPPAPRAAAGEMLAQLKTEAKTLRPLLESDLARAFVDAACALPPIEPRDSLFVDPATRRVYTSEQLPGLTEAQRATLRERVIDETFYYTTRYGTPLAYARSLDILARNGFTSAEGKRIVDFGYGGIGHLRLLASLGAHATGVDVDPLLEPLYAQPDDTGRIARADDAAKAASRSAAGSVALVTGRWPAEEDAARRVRSGAGENGCDLFLSKNTLKNGYVHPDPVRGKDIDPRRLINLGVDDEAYCREVFSLLKPGGLFLIYNICPAQAPADKPYIPWADGRCPFSREILEKTGFEVIAYDANDDEAVRAMAHALGWDKAEEGQPGMDLERDLFAWWTLARRPASK